MGIVISLLMMAGLPGDTWLRLIVWLIIGMVLYFTYGRYHSRVQAIAAGLPEPKSAPSMAD
jgi:APA family basic amino acid/polyamine antiporter